MLLVLLGLIKLAFVFVGGKSFDKHGRRICLTVSLVGMACALLFVGMSFTFQDDLVSTVLVMVGVAIYI